MSGSGAGREVRFEPRARRDLRRFARADVDAVLAAIERFAGQGVGHVKKLQGQHPPTWRLRVGRLRVLYRLEPGVIVVVTVDERRDVSR